MSKEMINFNGENYYLDIDAIIKWVLSSPNSIKEIEINEGYDINDDDGDLQLVSKVIREAKSTNSQDDTIKYDFIKLILTPFLGEITTFDDIDLNLSYNILFNTLIQMKFLIKK